MIEAVFISDLHLHPEDTAIKARFDRFLTWAQTSVKKIYILGDFFHAWAGDDGINEWSLKIAKQLHHLKDLGISLYYMHGNRDFLLGKRYAELAGFEILPEPTKIVLDGTPILLAHGDGYCTLDRKHQYFRFLTRNRIFSYLFLLLPLQYRKSLVDQVRRHSQRQMPKNKVQMDVVQSVVISEMRQHQAPILIHGHTHKPELIEYHDKGTVFKRYVLSDWDDTPKLLCYHSTRGLYFTHCESL